MRLLHTTKLIVEEFVESESGSYRYAILSHTWEEEEITFQDMQGEVPTHKKGFSKLENSCAQAKKDGYEYIWIDTCCIDKSSSAELSEAINSMYRWYESAAICYAYLSDVPPREIEDPWISQSRFRQSRWFTRGWTLQELIAPSKLIFFSQSWTSLGTKAELVKLIYDVTTIDKDVLLDERNILSTISVSRRMSWAARRKTTRVEDRSYSLLGIFDVNMPLLYGEGYKAFYRLQEEILKQTDDESLFAHYLPLGYWTYRKQQHYGSILALSPDCFSESGDIFMHRRDSRLHGPLEHIVDIPALFTNKGLQVNLLGCPCTYTSTGYRRVIHGWLMILDCGMRDDILSRPAVFLRQLDSGLDRFERFRADELLLIRGRNSIMMFSTRPKKDFIGQLERVYVDQSDRCSPQFEKLQRRTIFVTAESNPFQELHIRRPCVWVKEVQKLDVLDFELVQGWPNWNEQERRLSKESFEELLRAILFQEPKSMETFVVVADLKVLDPENNTAPESNKGLRYKTWCTIIELDAGSLDLAAVLGDIGGYMWHLDVLYLENKEFSTTAAIQGGVIVQVTLGLEEFLDRREFTLAINLHRSKDELMWKELRNIRIKFGDLG